MSGVSLLSWILTLCLLALAYLISMNNLVMTREVFQFAESNIGGTFLGKPKN